MPHPSHFSPVKSGTGRQSSHGMKNQELVEEIRKRLRTHSPFRRLKPQGLEWGQEVRVTPEKAPREASWTGQSAAGTRLARWAVRHRVCPPPQLSPGPLWFFLQLLAELPEIQVLCASAYWQWVTFGWNLSNCWGWKGWLKLCRSLQVSISVKGLTAPTDVSLEKLGKEGLAWDSA